MKIENIKFKAKRLDNGEWVEGSLLLSEKGKTCIGTMLDSNEENGSPICFRCKEVDPLTICQFTGLIDCEGNEIWEHDLIHFVGYSYTAEVIWSEGNYAFMVVCENKHSYWLHDVIELCRIERIDNKFDNKK